MKSIKANVQDGLNYSGKVKVGLMKNGKLFSVKKYTNEGRWPLFYFLCGCLAGDYTTINNYRPRYLQLFYKTPGSERDLPNPTTQSDFASYFDEGNLVSLLPYPYTDTPKIEKIEDISTDAIGSSKITYKFMIPFTQLNISASGNINYLALYCQEKVNQLAQPSVYVFVQDSDGKWANLITETVSDMQNWNIYIEWTLEISNFKPKED